MAEPYVSLTIDLPEDEAELAQSLLDDLGVAGLEIRDREAPPMPGVRGPSSGEAILIGYFGTDGEAASAEQALQEAFPRARILRAPVEQQDWANSWKALIRSVEVGRLWVGPPWLADAAPRDKLRLSIEPKMAFGTGDHPTTQLCLEVVDEFLGARPGASVLDVGTGTGVLAIAARRLGASRVVGTDNDAMSVTLALENAQHNGTPEVELSGRTLDQVDGTFDLVVANILANTLIELAPLIVPKVRQRLALAGILAHQRAEVEAAYVGRGLRALPGKQLGEWVRLDLDRP